MELEKSKTQPPQMSLEEFLEFEDRSEGKHEFHDGTVVAMAGASPTHVDIAGNVYVSLRASLKGKACRPYGSDLRVWVKKRRRLIYPDVTVVCGPLEHPSHEKSKVLVCNPRAVIEVISPSTNDYDRGEKFAYYSDIESLGEYILISQSSPLVQIIPIAPGGAGRLRSYVGLDRVAHLESLDVDLPLADVYEGVEFGPKAMNSEDHDQ